MSIDPEKAREIFVEAVRREPAERADLLAARCGGDDDLRRRVENLLRANDEAGSFLDWPAAADDPTDTHRPARGGGSLDVGTVIRPYKLVELIGEGGMGAVWLAQQTDPVKRLVALKVIKAGMDSKQVVARFEAERQALAMMDHPNIAKVHDAGATPDGRPFFVMELVKGVPITRFCDDHRLTAHQRLELFVPVCHAIQHAHQKGVIHRDIKPSNVLVALYDDRPVPKVIDFGVAKAAGPALTEQTLHTGFGAVVGTVEYMSPEQATFNQLDIDTRSDIYSLGVLLYELLTGSPPFSKRELERAGMLEMLRMIREDEPSKPSAKLSTADGLPTLAANRGTEPARLTRQVRGELDWIVMKALEKDRARRYETANGFAMDAQRYLADEPVLACPTSTIYRLKKFVRRNRARLAAVAALGLLLVGASGYAWYADRQAAVRERVEQARLERNAEAVANLLVQCEDALRADRADRAGVALDAAERRAADGGAEELADRLARCRADLDLLRELDSADAFHGTPVGRRLPRVREIVPRWRAALAAYGVPPDGDPATSAGRLNGSLVRDRALTALDLWLAADPSPGLRAVLRAMDPDPYRDAVRDAIAARDNPAVAALAARPDALAQPGRFAAVLGWHAAVPVERRRAVLQAALRARPGDLRLLVSMASSYAGRRRDAAERVRWLQAAVGAHPESPMAHNNLGTVLDDLKDIDGAIAAYQEAIRLDPQNASVAHANLGASLKNKGNPDAAIVEYQKALQLDSKNTGALVNWGRALEVKKDWKGAIAKYREAIGIDPDLGQARLNLGIALAKNGDPDGAIAQYEAAIRIDRSDVGSRTNLGAILADRGKPDEALALFKEVIRIDPTYALAHVNKGAILWEKGGWDEAMIAFREAVRLDPESALARTNLGSALMNSGELEAGLVELRKAVQLEPDDAGHRRNLSIGLDAAGDLNGAIAELEVLIKRDTKDVTARNFLAVTLRNHGELGRAMLLFQQLATEFEQEGFRHARAGGIVNSLVVCHEQLGQFDQAESWMRKLLAVEKKRFGSDSPTYAASLAWLGEYLLRRSKWREADAALQESLAIRKRKAPDSWSTFKTASLMGDALLGQKRYGEAERLLLDGYSGLKKLGKALSPKDKATLGAATQRLVRLYDAIAKKDEAAKWRAVLEQTEGPKVGGVHEVGDGIKLLGRVDRQVNTLIYTVKLTAGKTYFIDMAHLGRQSLDPYVELQDADHRPLDADYGGGMPVRIAYRVPRDGVYRILASSNMVAPGEFTLTVREKKDAGKPAAAPKTAEEWNVLGAEHAAKKDYPGAIDAFHKGLEIDGKEPTLWFNLGLALQKNKDLPGAIAAFEKAVALDVNEAEHHNTLAWLLATCSDVKLRDPGRAVTHAKEAVKLAPKNPNYPSTLGAAYYRARDWKAAIAALHDSRKLRDGGDAHEWFFLAMAHWQLGEKEEARKWYDRGAKWMEKHQPDSDELRRFRAEAADVLAAEPKKDD